MRRPLIRVRSRKTRYAFDGETGVLVLAGTLGTVAALTLQRNPQRDPTPRLTVLWDAAIAQDKTNAESSTYEAWQESEIDPAHVDYLTHEDGDDGEMEP